MTTTGDSGVAIGDALQDVVGKILWHQVVMSNASMIDVSVAYTAGQT